MFRRKTQAKLIFEDLVNVLKWNHKLEVDKKSEEKVKTMLEEHKNSLSAKLYNLFGFPQSYAIKERALGGTLEYRENLRYQEQRRKELKSISI